MNCLHCGQVLDAAAATDMSNIQPSDGSLSICFYCGHLMFYVIPDGGEWSFREPTPEELEELLKDPYVHEVHDIIIAKAHLFR